MAEPTIPSPEILHVDVLVVGAGISGIGMGYHLQTRCPDRSYAILEDRAAMGGTWDLFRYPGIRSDSDMHTLGFGFHPWTAATAIVDGPAIRAYVEDVVRTCGIDRHIRYGSSMVTEAFLSFTSGYVERATAALPRQGVRRPWKPNQNYVLDMLALRFGSIDDAMILSQPRSGGRAGHGG